MLIRGLALALIHLFLFVCDFLRWLLSWCKPAQQARKHAQGQHPQALRHIGLVLSDRHISCSELTQRLQAVLAVLKAARVQVVTLHDVHGTLHQADTSPLSRVFGAGTAGAEMHIVSPDDTTRAWEGMLRQPANSNGCCKGASGSTAMDGLTSEEHSAYLARRVRSATAGDSAPDMDLVLVAGPVLCLAGLPPWQTRFCEVQHLGCLDYDCSDRVREALVRYHTSLQRFGR
jgi:hypothetical protein